MDCALEDLLIRIQELSRGMEVTKCQNCGLVAHVQTCQVAIVAIQKELEVIKRQICWLKDNDQKQQLEINNHARRIMNDFPVEPWNDN